MFKKLVLLIGFLGFSSQGLAYDLDRIPPRCGEDHYIYRDGGWSKDRTLKPEVRVGVWFYEEGMRKSLFFDGHYYSEPAPIAVRIKYWAQFWLGWSVWLTGVWGLVVVLRRYYQISGT